MATTFNPPGIWQPFGAFSMMKIQGAGRIVHLKGQVSLDRSGEVVGRGDMRAQVRQALENIAAVLEAGGAKPQHVTRLTWYVRDIDEYLAARKELGAAYRAVMGDHFPAMALVEVSRLVEPQARVEIEATAVVPRR